MTGSVDDSPEGSYRNVFRTRFVASERPSLVIVRALAAIEGVEPSELEALYEYVDPEALDEFLAIGTPGSGDRLTAVEFSVSNYRILAEGDGQITIFERRRDDRH